MNFELNEDQRALQESVHRLLNERYGFENRRQYVEADAGHDEKTWSALSELGLTALLVPEDLEGFGGGAVDLFPVMQELGAVLSLEPLLATNFLPATALRTYAGDARAKEALQSIASGERRIAWAHDEVEARHTDWWISTRATKTGEKWLLSGQKFNVVGANDAHQYLVSARVQGSTEDTDGCALFLVNADAKGLSVRNYKLVDDTPAGELTFSNVSALPLGEAGDGHQSLRAIESALAMGIAAACADMVGAAGAAFQLAIEYVNTRKQFGRLIGENQALRHRASEMLVSLELAKSMAIAAAVAVDDQDSEGAELDLHRAKLSVAKHARAVAHGAIQLHGGIGMTEEYAVGHYLRRVHVLDQLFGDGEAHTARLASLLHA
ncbi:acyl-CoA dehydrogenase family protein [Cupriavidus metallidurans]|uniref:Acyl-CoA dehydrogenase n=1 Tax=Cupriavidus metallidurans (strain ATCC 43123 / DSM 2839 / NBRC 102507 / CH34) TaxID=266264 RepID=Q1LBT8_CUPMC|nr:acyl-CoA dehydrogenase family protein [Cupriavidus metallidurans]ABF12388.1 putative acyl-CoA dehydrogenase [Cupriavidus metallidurans CH34]QGS32382.1 acyl-CoA dehydrogenase [Cupriavidus metallidurans]